MNKRDFILQSGGVLLSGAAWLPTVGHACPSAASSGPAANADRLVSLDAGHSLQAWQALQGLSFGTHTTLGRPVQLVLSQVSVASGLRADTALAQFTVTLQGPRGMPLQAGLHSLHHPSTGPVSLYLEPHQQGEHISYAAHFSLTT